MLHRVACAADAEHLTEPEQMAGTGPEHRCVLHIDMDCFYCQVEHNRLGIPLEEPLAVVQWAGLIAVNYAARAAGVTRHDKASVAMQKCPKIRLVHVEYIGADGPEGSTGGAGATDAAAAAATPPDDVSGQQVIGAPTDRNAVKACLERYRTVSSAIFSVLKRHCSACEKGSLDEAYLDVTGLALQAVRAGPHAAWLRRSGGGGGGGQLPDSEVVLPWEGHVYCGQADGASQSLSQASPCAESTGDVLLSAAAALCTRIREVSKR